MCNPFISAATIIERWFAVVFSIKTKIRHADREKQFGIYWPRSAGNICAGPNLVREPPETHSVSNWQLIRCNPESH